MDNSQIVEIPLNKIFQTENSRADYRESELAELMASMKQIGLLQAVGLKAINKDRYEIVYGNRRFLAAKKLGWKKVPAVMVEAESEEDFLLKNTTENIVRAGVPLSEQGRIFHRLTQLGLTSSEIAARLGQSTSVVSSALDMFRRVPKKYQNKIVTGSRVGEAGRPKQGLIPMGAAKAIEGARKDFELDKANTEQLFDLAAQDGISIGTVRSVAKLIGQGFEMKEALATSLDAHTVRVGVVISKKEIERIEEKHQTSIGRFLYGIIAGDSRVKVIKASDK